MQLLLVISSNAALRISYRLLCRSLHNDFDYGSLRASDEDVGLIFDIYAMNLLKTFTVLQTTVILSKIQYVEDPTRFGLIVDRLHAATNLITGLNLIQDTISIHSIKSLIYSSIIYK